MHGFSQKFTRFHSFKNINLKGAISTFGLRSKKSSFFHWCCIWCASKILCKLFSDCTIAGRASAYWCTIFYMVLPGCSSSSVECQALFNFKNMCMVSLSVHKDHFPWGEMSFYWCLISSDWSLNFSLVNISIINATPVHSIIRRDEFLLLLH